MSYCQRCAEHLADVQRLREDVSEIRGAYDRASQDLHDKGLECLRLRDHVRVMREALEEALPRIQTWSEAYPIDVFSEPDWVKVRELLGDTLLTQVSASNMRHVVTRVWAILADTRAAFDETEPRP